MFGRDDWDRVKARWSALWQHELIDRCLVSVTAPRDAWRPAPPPTQDQDLLRYWTDPAWVLARARASIAHTYYAGDAFALHWVNLGPSGHAGFFRGARPTLTGDSVWYEPSIHDWQRDAPVFDRDSLLYRQTLAVTEHLVEESRGQFVVSMPDCSGNLDVVAHLRGSEEMLMDLVLAPEQVATAMQAAQQAYASILKDVWPMVRDNNDGGGCVGWLRTWAPGLHSQMQSDASVMISPAAFRRFVVPEISAQCDLLDYALYHFDGIEQIRHLETLLSIKGLRMIQWTQVAGQPSALAYIPELRRIQAAGIALLIVVRPEQIEPLLAQLSSRGLALITNAATPEEADALVASVARWTRDQPA